MKRKICCCGMLIVFCLLTLGESSRSQGNQPVRPTRISSCLQIDGHLNEPEWSLAPVLSNFVTLHPSFGQPPSERTELLVLYDRKNLYIGFKSYGDQLPEVNTDPDGTDEAFSSDWIAFCLDTFGDELGAFFFGVTPFGLQVDGTLNAEGTPSFANDLEWNSGVSRDENGYMAEFAIPFHSLPFRQQSRIIMGFKAARFIARYHEEVDFPAISPDQASHLGQFATIEFFDIEAGSVADLPPLTDLNEIYQRKVTRSLNNDTQTLEGRMAAWGDASVVDRQIFPERRFPKSSDPFYFKKEIRAARVKSIFEPLKYAPGKSISDLDHFLSRTETAAFIVILRDTVIYEKYYNGFSRESLVTSFSVAKSFASTLIGVALSEGFISNLDDPVTQYLPEFHRLDARFPRITLKDLVSMTSGLRYEEAETYFDDAITYYSPDLRSAAVQQTEIVDPPGHRFLYNNYNPLLLGMVLEKVTDMSVSDYLSKKLWQPLQMEYPGSWSLDSEQSGFEKMESGLNARAIDFAKLGRLFLMEGVWQGTRIVPVQWVIDATQPREERERTYPPWPFFRRDGGYYGYFWWGRKRSGGKSDFFALGNKGQYIYVCPQKQLIIVRNGIQFGVPSMRWVSLFFEFATKI